MKISAIAIAVIAATFLSAEMAVSGTTTVEPGVQPTSSMAVPLLSGSSVTSITSLGSLPGRSEDARKLLENPPGSSESRSSAVLIAESLALDLAKGSLPRLNARQVLLARVMLQNLIAEGQKTDAACCAHMVALLNQLDSSGQ